MRVIGGAYRSRLLTAPRGLSTRPTSDRLRETLFNVLAARIEGAAFADLYAGSGAVGIEALSRGASHVSFVENAPAGLAAIRANLASLNIQSGFRIEAGDVAGALRAFSAARTTPAWNLVFLDPPYQVSSAYLNTLTTLGEAESALLAPHCMVIAEHQHKQPLASQYGLLHRTRVLKQGDAALSFYQMAGSE